MSVEQVPRRHVARLVPNRDKLADLARLDLEDQMRDPCAPNSLPNTTALPLGRRCGRLTLTVSDSSKTWGSPPEDETR